MFLLQSFKTTTKKAKKGRHFNRGGGRGGGGGATYGGGGGGGGGGGDRGVRALHVAGDDARSKASAVGVLTEDGIA